MSEKIERQTAESNVDRWGAREWFDRMVNAVENRNRCVREGNLMGYDTWNNVVSSSASRLANDFAVEVRATLAAPQAPGTVKVPEGMVLVPREPTEAMRNAAASVLEDAGIDGTLARAMLRAALAPASTVMET